jgi:hypothetical protein
MSTFLAGLAGASAARLEQGADDARHAGRMAEISADNATAAANNAARLAHQSAVNGKMAVEEGREQTQAIRDDIGKVVNKHMIPAFQENAAAISALTELVKADIQQNKGINARLDRLEHRLEQQLKSQINQAE